MKTKLYLGSALLIVGFAASLRAPETSSTTHAPGADGPQAIFLNYQDFKWGKILPDLGESSPEICILHVDPKTQATKLMIRTPKAIHVRKHWHSENETHTIIKGTAVFACDGKRIELVPDPSITCPQK
jgi:mannose-6-phosphate isomerase-like protein (cupin superfamily)